MDMQKTLETLCALPAISGYELDSMRAVAQMLDPLCDEVETDAFGNVIGWLYSKKANAKTLLLDAHMDQIGFLVTEVLDGGFLRFTSVGGVDPRMLLGNEVMILAKVPLYGIISCMPPHLLHADEQDRAIPITEMVIDTGLLDARTCIAIGTPIVFAQTPAKLSDSSFTSKCLDDRAGVAALIRSLALLSEEKERVCHVAVLMSAQEEVTGLGAQIGTFAVAPDCAIAVDVTHGKTPDGPTDGVFQMGGGTVIGVGPNMHKGMTEQLIKLAKAEDIPYQLEVMEGNTGTNAWTMQIVAHGVAMCLLSIPERYMHTPIETVCLSDIEDTAKLIYAFVHQFDEEVLA